MVFSSLIFVFVFFVIYLTVYRLVDDRHKNMVLLVVSLVFYAWGGPEFLVLLVGETFVSWLSGVLIGRSDNPASRSRLILILWTGKQGKDVGHCWKLRLPTNSAMELSGSLSFMKIVRIANLIKEI